MLRRQSVDREARAETTLYSWTDSLKNWMLHSSILENFLIKLIVKVMKKQ